MVDWESIVNLLIWQVGALGIARVDFDCCAVVGLARKTQIDHTLNASPRLSVETGQRGHLDSKGC